MGTVTFNTLQDSFNVEHIIYAGSVQEIPEQLKKNDMTHSFKIITRSGSVYCYYKDIETARKARTILGDIMDSIKPCLFRSGNDIVDIKSIISYSRIVKLKNNENGKTHAFTVTIDTVNEKSNTIWFAYKSEENAKKARAVLWSMIESSHKKLSSILPDEKPETTVAECSADNLI